jgi:uncharacterized oxidoreductase
MELKGRTVLVTGGTSGIGLALATRFQRAGSRVVVCGRRERALLEARAAHPGLETRVCDVADPAARVELARWAVEAHPHLDVLVNNAGIQRRVPAAQLEPWHEIAAEIAVNLEAPIHLAKLLAPHLKARPSAAIVNVTSGLAFAPLALAPVYSATKAALHSFTLALRHDLQGTPVEVIEIVPPAVNTDLGGAGLHTFGVALDEFADAVFARLAQGGTEIAYGTAERSSRASREELDAMFARMNQGR